METLKKEKFYENLKKILQRPPSNFYQSFWDNVGSDAI